MSSPAPLAKGRRSRKQTLGSENTETTLSSSAVSQSASLTRAVADVGDRRHRFSSRSERRGNNPQPKRWFPSPYPPHSLYARSSWHTYPTPRPQQTALA